MQEKWKYIKGYEGLYQASNLGRIKRLSKANKDKRSKEEIAEHFIKGSIYNNKYTMINLCKNGIIKRKPLHRIIAELFVKNPNDKPYVNHLDGNPQNNKAENLEWCTPLENVQHAWKTGLIDKEKMSALGKKYIELNCRNNEKPVYQLTKENIVVGKYKSIKEAEQQTGITNKHISSVCKGKRKTAGGYVWKYIFKEEI